MRNLTVLAALLLLNLLGVAACDVFVHEDNTPDHVIIQEDTTPDVVVEDKTPDVHVDIHEDNSGAGQSAPSAPDGQ